MSWYNRGTYEELCRLAGRARLDSYCPYSKYQVGAAALFLNERDQHGITTGCNIESASYGLTICAERVAVFKAVSGGYRRLLVLAVTCDPCGACLQVMSEFSRPETLVVVDGVGIWKLSDLLPRPFKL